MSKINIVYLHGFASDGSSTKGVLLKQHFKSPDFNIITPSLKSNPIDAINQIRTILSTGNNFILVGTSLGGFYADYFNKFADTPCVLINPLIDVTTIERHIGKNKNYNSEQTFDFSKKDFIDLLKLDDKKNQLGYSDSPEYVLIAKDDELCPWKLAKETFIYNNQSIEFFNKGGHRFDNDNAVIETVKELIEDINGYDFFKLFDDNIFESKRNTLNERYVNLFKRNEKQQYFSEIEQLIIESYSYIGGYGSDISEFLDDNFMWKLVRKNGKIIAGKIYKDRLGRKAVCGFTNGTADGKIAFKSIVQEDLKLGRAWVEVSGKAENIYRYSMKATPLPHELVKLTLDLTGKKVYSWDEDGYHYTREINGELKTKAMYGNVLGVN